MLYHGTVIRDDQCFTEYAGARSIELEAWTLWPRSRGTERLVSFEVERLLLGSSFVPVDLDCGRMFLNQSYSDVWRNMAQRFFTDGRVFALETAPVAMAGCHVVLGGPIDGVWYHWLFNWAPRLLLLRRLRPDILADPAVRIAVHPLALEEPYRAVLDSFGLAPERYVPLDPARDHLFERAVLVSFCDQVKLYPGLMREMAAHLIAAFGIAGPAAGREERLFASRQGLPGPKRRIANFAAVRPVLDEFGCRVAALGTLSAAAQAGLFHHADIVVGAHGSDLTGLLFCRPGTDVLVIEHHFSIRNGLHDGLTAICDMLGLRYEALACDPAPRNDIWANTNHGQADADYLVDPARLRERLADIVARRDGGCRDGGCRDGA